jgi:hypothetical protein
MKKYVLWFKVTDVTPKIHNIVVSIKYFSHTDIFHLNNKNII